jgi:hypothetical protein
VAANVMRKSETKSHGFGTPSKPRSKPRPKPPETDSETCSKPPKPPLKRGEFRFLPATHTSGSNCADLLVLGDQGAVDCNLQEAR